MLDSNYHMTVSDTKNYFEITFYFGMENAKNCHINRILLWFSLHIITKYVI